MSGLTSLNPIKALIKKATQKPRGKGRGLEVGASCPAVDMGIYEWGFD